LNLQRQRASHGPRQTSTTGETAGSQQHHQRGLPSDLGTSPRRRRKSHFTLRHREDGSVPWNLVRRRHEHGPQPRGQPSDSSQGISVPRQGCKQHWRIRSTRDHKEHHREERIR